MAEPELLDDDDDLKYFGVGPGRQAAIAHGPVDAVYADGAIDRHCKNCGATPLSYCRHESGALRILPCKNR